MTFATNYLQLIWREATKITVSNVSEPEQTLVISDESDCKHVERGANNRPQIIEFREARAQGIICEERVNKCSRLMLILK